MHTHSQTRSSNVAALSQGLSLALGSLWVPRGFEGVMGLGSQTLECQMSSAQGTVFHLEEVALTPYAIDNDLSQEPDLVLHQSGKYLQHRLNIH